VDGVALAWELLDPAAFAVAAAESRSMNMDDATAYAVWG
jgi:hypothetical protein